MKRVFILFICLILIFSCVISVSAESFSDPRYDVVELLNSDYYEVSCIDGGKVWSNSSYILPELYIVNSNFAQFTWQAQAMNVGFESIYLTFRFDGIHPGSVQLFNDVYQGKSFNGTEVSCFQGLHQYRFIVDNANISNLSIKVNWEGSTSGYVKLLSLRGFNNEVIDIDTASFSYFHTFFQANKIEQIQDDYGSNYPLPLTYQFERNDPDDQIFQGRAFYYISAVQRKLRNCDSLILFFNAIDDQADITVSLIDTSNSNAVLTVLPFSVTRTETRHTYDDYAPGNWFEWPISQYQLVIDTSGYNLESYTIQVCIEVMDYTSSAGRSIFVQFDSGYVVPSSADVPWYKVFFGWISDKYDMLGNKLDNILSALDPKDSEFEEAQEEAKQKADEIDDMNKFMETIPRFDPSTSDIDFDMQQYLLPASVTVNSGLVMTSILGNKPWVLTMITLVFTMSLVGYIFFGKR